MDTANLRTQSVTQYLTDENPAEMVNGLSMVLTNISPPG